MIVEDVFDGVGGMRRPSPALGDAAREGAAAAATQSSGSVGTSQPALGNCRILSRYFRAWVVIS